MAIARVVSVNTGRGRDEEWAGRLKRTAIDKRPVAGPVAVGRLGLAGDEQVDKPDHGGYEQALYAYAREDLDWWVERLGRELASGTFGENITTSGLEVTGGLIGEVWRLGSAVVQVTSPRIPCAVFAGWMDERQWVKRFADAGRVGAYLRVLEEGQVSAGDPVEKLARPATRLTIAESVRAYYGDVDLMRRLLTVEGRSSKWDEIALSVLGRPGAIAEDAGAAAGAGPAGTGVPGGPGR
ncbi:MAG TPA: MOSC domain-containing protein [Streptosporangiaceae bacterium]|nr:MOSC domain-containing protein [Streptosporangiaceae bacterium]